jgi:uncharacterized protein involved in exopolysaccharide biosynthesis
MDFLAGSLDDPNGRIVPYADTQVFSDGARNLYPALNGHEGMNQNELDVRRLLRKYWLLLSVFLVLGAAAGFASIVLSSPRYKTRLLLEVLGTTSVIKSAVDTGNFEANEVNIQTQISILRSGTFLKRAADRFQSETVPLAPTGRDIFSRLRQRVHPATQDPLENARNGLAVAIETFDARPVNHTRLIELTCESTSPDVAAQYLNSMADEYREDTSRSRLQASQKTS